MSPELANSVQHAVVALIERGRAAIADGRLTFAEIGDVGTATIEVALELAEFVRELPDSIEDKKALILKAVDDFYTGTIAPLNIPGVPDFLEAAVVDPALGASLHFVVSYTLDAALKRASGASVLRLA